MAIIYARCSTIYQNMNNYQSLDNQIALCNLYCVNKCFNVINIIKEIIPGHDIKKSTIYNTLINNKNIKLIIAEPSRLTRNINQINNIINICKKNNIILHFVRNNLISSNKYDINIIKTCVKNANIETNVLSSRVASVIKLKKSLGSYYGRVPYGYIKKSYIDKKTKIKIHKLIKNKEEQKNIKLIINMYKKHNINYIFNHMNKKKLLNKTKKWNYYSIKNIINKYTK